MTKVFIGGSRRISRLNKGVKRRLDKVIANRLTVIIGDANGADKAVQGYLASKHYDKVIVFCMVGECRNNIGNWPTREIVAATGARRDFAYYATKDRAMGREADYGLMLWDGKSRGTITNIDDLVQREKPVVVYVAPSRSFVTLRERDQLTHLVGRFHPAMPQRVNRTPHARRSHPKPEVSLF